MIIEIEQLKHDFDAALKSIKAAVVLYGPDYVVQELQDHVHATWDDGDILGFFSGLEGALEIDRKIQSRESIEAQICQLEKLLAERKLRKPS